MRFINVLISDGNRFANWDYPPETTIGYIVRSLKFKPVAGTVLVGLQKMEKDLDDVRLMDCPQEKTPDGKQIRVRIMMDSVKPKKQLEVVAGNEWLEVGESVC